MSRLETLRTVTYQAGALLQADKIAVEAETLNGVKGFVLRFENGTLHVGVQDEDDTIVLSFEPLPKDPEVATLGVQQVEPWTQVYGCCCLWAWLLINQQGYEDGVRLEFTTKPESTFIELICAASTLHWRSFKAGF